MLHATTNPAQLAITNRSDVTYSALPTSKPYDKCEPGFEFGTLGLEYSLGRHVLAPGHYRTCLLCT